jgi:glucose-6-phosphate 1-dehydrogenase
MDCLHGDATLFTRSDEVLAAWTFVDEILKAWKDHPVQKLPQYKPGTWGPPEVDDFMHQHGSAWHETSAEKSN